MGRAEVFCLDPGKAGIWEKKYVASTVTHEVSENPPHPFDNLISSFYGGCTYVVRRSVTP